MCDPSREYLLRVKGFWSFCPFLYCEPIAYTVWNCVSHLGQALVYRVGVGTTKPPVKGGELGTGRMYKLEVWDCCGLGVGVDYVGLS